jgi:hypothetical protein
MLDNNFAPLANTTDAIKKLEQYVFDDLDTSGSRSVFCYARNRFVFLHRTVGGILRGESVCKAELSDSLFHMVGKVDKDVHKYIVLIQQILTGKTNTTAKLLGQIMRHKDSMSLCAIGVLTFYLLYRTTSK